MTVVRMAVKFRRDESQDWAEANPVLAKGEPGFEIDTGKFKIGDGVARWLDLTYFYPGKNPVIDDSALGQALQAHINSLTPHPVYDDGPSLLLLYQNAKV